MSALTFISAQVPAELAARLRASAERNERSVSAELRVAVRAYLDGDDAEQAPQEAAA